MENNIILEQSSTVTLSAEDESGAEAKTITVEEYAKEMSEFFEKVNMLDEENYSESTQNDATNASASSSSASSSTTTTSERRGSRYKSKKGISDLDFVKKNRIQDIDFVFTDTKSSISIYVGTVEGANNRDLLHSKKITHILTVGKDLVVKNNKKPFTHSQISIADQPNESILKILGEAIYFIDKAFNEPNSNILVHCKFGISRSVSVIVAWLVVKGHCPNVTSALSMIRKDRPYAKPNPGFHAQLLQLEKCNGDIEKAQHSFNTFLKAYAKGDKPKYMSILMTRRFKARKFVEDVGKLAGKIDVKGTSIPDSAIVTAVEESLKNSLLEFAEEFPKEDEEKMAMLADRKLDAYIAQLNGLVEKIQKKLKMIHSKANST